MANKYDGYQKISLKALLKKSPKQIASIWQTREEKKVLIFDGSIRTDNEDNTSLIHEMINEEMCTVHDWPHWQEPHALDKNIITLSAISNMSKEALQTMKDSLGEHTFHVVDSMGEKYTKDELSELLDELIEEARSISSVSS